MIEGEFISIWYVFSNISNHVTWALHQHHLWQTLQQDDQIEPVSGLNKETLKNFPYTICQTDYSTDSEEEYTVAVEAYCNVQG